MVFELELFPLAVFIVVYADVLLVFSGFDSMCYSNSGATSNIIDPSDVCIACMIDRWEVGRGMTPNVAATSADAQRIRML